MSNSSDRETIEFPYEITDVDPTLNAELKKLFPGDQDGFVEIGPRHFVYPSRFRELAPQLWNFQARPDDVWVSTYPRSGTTLTQEIVWLILNELNIEKAKQIHINQRFPFFEWTDFINNDVKEVMLNSNPEDPVMQGYIKAVSVKTYESLARAQRQRLIKTHIPMSMLPPSVMQVKAKVIYVARHPKDVVVSNYHLDRLIKPGYIGDFDTYCKYFEENKMNYCPHFQHLDDAWTRRHEPNVLLIFYEELIKDLPDTLRKIAAFLGKSLSESDIKQLCSHLSIESFKKNPTLNRSNLKTAKVFNADAEDFIRNGKCSGSGWQKEFTPEIIERFERYMASTYADTEFRFPDL